jgi:hypothetical protein
MAQSYEIEGEAELKPQRRHVLAASAVVLAAVLVGLGAFALSGGLDRTVTERVHGGGGTRVVRVALVDAVVGFDVTPDRLVVDPGTPLALDVVNEGDEVHDLAVQSGPRTRRLDPGHSERLELGVISTSLPQLYCTLPAHTSAGMTLDIQIQGQGGRRLVARSATSSTRAGRAAVTAVPGQQEYRLAPPDTARMLQPLLSALRATARVPI